MERWGSVWCGTGTAMGQSDHLGRVTQTSLWFQATHPEITSTRCPSCYSPVDVSSHCVVQHRAKTAAEAGRGRPSLLAGATGPARLLPCSVAVDLGASTREARSGWRGVLAWQASHTLSLPMTPHCWGNGRGRAASSRE